MRYSISVNSLFCFVRRPVEKKSSPELTKPKTIVTEEVKSTEPTKSSMKKPIEETKSNEPIAKMISNSTSKPISSATIVDMPLITSTNLLSVIAPTTTTTEQKRTTSIARTPAIKKPENEKPRIIAQSIAEQNAARNQKNLEMSNGVELKLNPVRTTDESIKEKFVKV